MKKHLKCCKTATGFPIIKLVNITFALLVQNCPIGILHIIYSALIGHFDVQYLIIPPTFFTEDDTSLSCTCRYILFKSLHII
jgi:hypothetical protein